MTRIAVTGGAGMIGSYIARRLLEKGHDVKIIDDLSRGKMSNVQPLIDEYRARVTFIEANLANYDNAADSLRGVEEVFHLAAIVGGVNLAKTAKPAIIPAVDYNVIYASIAHHIHHILYTSTACAFPLSVQTPNMVNRKMIESDMDGPLDPENLYGLAKAYGEHMFRKFREVNGIGLTIVRDFNVYGPGEDNHPIMGHAIPMLIRRALTEIDKPLTVYGSGEQWRAFIYADDIAEGMIRAFERIRDATAINLGSEHAIQIKDLARLVLKVCGRPNAAIIFDKTQSEGVFWRCPDITRARSLLDWEPTTALEVGLHKTAEYYVSELKMVTAHV